MFILIFIGYLKMLYIEKQKVSEGTIIGNSDC